MKPAQLILAVLDTLVYGSYIAFLIWIAGEVTR